MKNLFNRVRFAIATAVIRVLYTLDKNVIVITFDHYNELCGDERVECDYCNATPCKSEATFCAPCLRWICVDCEDNEYGDDQDFDSCCAHTCKG